MAIGSISVPRTATALPDRKNTKKSQKRQTLGEEYNAISVNNELDYLHERLNLIVVESESVDDLESSATLSDVITRVNLITQILRSSGLLRNG